MILTLNDHRTRASWWDGPAVMRATPPARSTSTPRRLWSKLRPHHSVINNFIVFILVLRKNRHISWGEMQMKTHSEPTHCFSSDHRRWYWEGESVTDSEDAGGGGWTFGKPLLQRQQPLEVRVVLQWQREQSRRKHTGRRLFYDDPETWKTLYTLQTFQFKRSGSLVAWSGQGPPPVPTKPEMVKNINNKKRQDELEQRHQELLARQRQLQVSSFCSHANFYQSFSHSIFIVAA